MMVLNGPLLASPQMDSSFFGSVTTELKNSKTTTTESSLTSTSALNRQVGEGAYSSPYRSFEIQPAEFCHRNRLGWCEANVVKYVTRFRNKNGLEDLKKAQHYLEMLMEFEYGNVRNDQ